MSIDLRKMLLAGHRVKWQEEEAAEAAKSKTLRGGNTGYITDEGDIKGQCARKTLMRYHGIQEPPKLENTLMFEAGQLSEEAVIAAISKAWDGDILTQKECATYWEVSGIPVTGSPDIVLAKNGKPIFGIEKKLVSAYNTAKKVGPWEAPSPKLEHVAQAIHYSVKLGNVPWCILYANRTQWAIPFWDEKQYTDVMFTRPEIDVKVNKYNKTVPGKILPFYSIFYLDIHNGVVYYRHENSEQWIDTDITVDGIVSYYQLVADCIESNTLPDRYKYDGMQYWDAYGEKYNYFWEEHELYDSGTIDYDTFLDLCKTKGD